MVRTPSRTWSSGVTSMFRFASRSPWTATSRSQTSPVPRTRSRGTSMRSKAVTRSCLYYAVRVATDPTIPANGGCYRPIQLRARSGSIVAATPPAAVAAGNVETSQRIADVLLGALAKAAPNRVHAASQGTMNNVLVGAGGTGLLRDDRWRRGRRSAPFRTVGHPHRYDEHRNTPIESLETHYPFRVIAFGSASRLGRRRSPRRGRGDRARDRVSRAWRTVADG